MPERTRTIEETTVLYEYKSDGEVVERVRPAQDSPNAAQLAALAADERSGWSRVDETEPDAEPAAPARGRKTAAAAAPAAGGEA